jgi:DNA-binding LytR/AlgR family response regulator
MDRPYYLIECESKIQKIFLSDILYIGIVEERTTFQLTNQRRYCEISLKDLEEIMPNDFLRISRNYIVNTTIIQEFIKKDRVLVLFNGHRLTVSQRNVSHLTHFMRKMSVSANVYT